MENRSNVMVLGVGGFAQSVMQMATDGARALAHNGFKIPLMQNLVKRAISA